MRRTSPALFASVALIAAALILMLFVAIGRYIGDRVLMHESRKHAAPMTPLPQARAHMPLPAPSKLRPRPTPAASFKP